MTLDEAHSLRVPLFEVLDAVGFGHHKAVHYFNTGTLFWSLTRLFGCYERVMVMSDQPRERRVFLEEAIENFIIRFRIVSNDIAYVAWQLFPSDTRGLKGPRGGTHPENKEISFFGLSEFLAKNNAKFPELAGAFENAQSWKTRLKNDRDNVVHYKSRAVVFESDPTSFALLNAAGTERTEQTPDGGKKVVTEPVKEFVNSQMFHLHRFMHVELCEAVRNHAQRMGMKMKQIGSNARIRCTGIERFRRMNAIAA